MTDTVLQNNSAYNLESHYSNNTKAIRPQNVIVEAPYTIPKYHLFSDKDANARLTKIDNDIYEGIKIEKNKKNFNKSLFLKIFLSLAILVGGSAVIKKVINIFRKS